jgi:hypothetical protein
MRSAALTLALLIVLAGVAPATATVPTGVTGGQDPPTAAGLAVGPTFAQIDADRPSTGIRIELQPDTDARWTITYRYDLATEDEVEAFRSLEEEYESGGGNVGLDVGVFRSMAEQASESTGRNMQIRNVEREAVVVRNETTPSTETPATTPTTTASGAAVNATGVLRLSFTWTNFLEQNDNGSLELGDVFVTPDGDTWLSSLDPDQRVTVVTPEGFVISRTSFPIQQQNGSLIIDGPREFTSEERLAVTYRPSDQAEVPWTLIVGGGVAAVVVLALLFAFLRGGIRSGRTTPDGTAMTNGGETSAKRGPPDDAGDTAAAGSAAETGGEVDAETGGEVGAGVGSEATTDDDAAEPDFDLLSDEERVEYLLEQRGGRMKQANIVKETGWSDAKVSQLLSSMAEEDRVEKLRLGRENLISLPDRTFDGDGRED